MQVPLSANLVLPVPSPVQGSVAAADAAAKFLQDVKHDCTSYRSNVDIAWRTTQEGRGKTVEKLRSKLKDTLIPGAERLSASAEAAKKGFNSYAAEVDRIHEDARKLKDRVDDHLSTIRTKSGVVEDILAAINRQLELVWDAPPSATMPEPELNLWLTGSMDQEEKDEAKQQLAAAYSDSWNAAVTGWSNALDGIDDERVKWKNLVENRENAEQALLRTLRDTDLGRLIAIGSASGVPGPKIAIAAALSGELRGVPQQLANELVKKHPLLEGLFEGGDASGSWDSPPNDEAVAAWWQSLTPEQQQQLIDEVPWVIGNLPGLPFAVRNEANRLVLEYYVNHSEQLSPKCKKALKEIMEALYNDNGEPSVSIVALNLDGDVPFAAVGYGDLDGAGNLTWEAPGMFNDVERGLPGWDTASKNLYNEQMKRLKVAGRAGEGTAAIAFLSYDTPDFATVLSEAAANKGADRFAAELDGTYATRAVNTPLPNLAVLAHSYGTTMATIALTRTKHPVQSLTMIGSAGIDGQTVKSFERLNVDRDETGRPKVYTTLAGKDGLAPFGSDLSGRLQPNYVGDVQYEGRVISGAYSFSSEGSGYLKQATDHPIIIEGAGDGYMDVDTQSLNSVANLTIGEPGQVVGGLTVNEAVEYEVWMWR